MPSLVLALACLLLPLSTLSFASPVAHLGKRWTDDHAECRFSPTFTQSSVVSDPDAFAWQMLYWEGQFHANDIGYNTANGMTYDGTLIDPVTGLNNVSEKHVFSAASKEAIQIMVYAKALAGDEFACRFVSPDDHAQGPQKAASIMRTKLDTYLRFNSSFPGYGGVLPWFYANETDIRPTSDWINRIPALDNGELVWSVYAAVGAMEMSGNSEWKDLAQRWTAWLDYVKLTMKRLFYLGNGKVCAVTYLNETLSPFDSAQNITCASGEGNILDDPYEGELVTWWLYFYGGLSKSEKEELWSVKRPKLRAVEYTGSIVDTPFNQSTAANYTGLPVVSRQIGPITVQEGFWFSAHEQWKVLQLPYYDIPIVKRLFTNAERVRTCNSVLMGQNAGLFASVNNVTNIATGQIEDGYISYAGIPSIASQTLQELDIITPYGAFPTILVDKGVGLAWYKNMLDAPAMQNPYGSTESIRRDGSAWSSFVSWDSKILNVAAVLGGSSDLAGRKMKKEGIYGDFVAVLQREFGAVFKDIKGEDVELCLPDYQVPTGLIQDYTSCQ